MCFILLIDNTSVTDLLKYTEKFASTKADNKNVLISYSARPICRSISDSLELVIRENLKPYCQFCLKITAILTYIPLWEIYKREGHRWASCGAIPCYTKDQWFDLTFPCVFPQLVAVILCLVSPSIIMSPSNIQSLKLIFA